MRAWSLEQQVSAVYSQLFLISLSVKRIATALEARELRSESSHPIDVSSAVTIVSADQRDEKETLTTPLTSATKENDKRQQVFPFDASRVRPTRGRSNAGSDKPVNFEGREPEEAMTCDEGSTEQGFGHVVVDESAG